MQDAPVGDECDDAVLAILPPARTQHLLRVRLRLRLRVGVRVTVRVGEPSSNQALTLPLTRKHRDEVRHTRVEDRTVLSRVQVGAWIGSRLGLGVGLGFRARVSAGRCPEVATPQRHPPETTWSG